MISSLQLTCCQGTLTAVKINCNNKLEVENITETQQHLFLDKQYCRLISAHVNEYAQCEYLQASMYIMLQYIYIYIF